MLYLSAIVLVLCVVYLVYAIIDPLYIPIALKGVKYRPMGADSILSRNIMVYGLGGIIAPFAGIKLIDLALSLAGLFQCLTDCFPVFYKETICLKALNPPCGVLGGCYEQHPWKYERD